MAKWIFKGISKGLEEYECSNCKYRKSIMHPSGPRTMKDGSKLHTRCQCCKEEIRYSKKDYYPIRRKNDIRWTKKIIRNS